MDYCRDKEARARHATVKRRNFEKKCKSVFVPGDYHTSKFRSFIINKTLHPKFHVYTFIFFSTLCYRNIELEYLRIYKVLKYLICSFVIFE